MISLFNGLGESELTGTTPLDPDEGDALIPSHVFTQEELNAWEQANIRKAEVWALSGRRRLATTLLTFRFAEELHRRMFDQTWKWAGRYRVSGKNIGVPATEVRVLLRERLGDAVLWLESRTYPVDEIAARLHHHLVLVHPWPNGNGRWARLMADALLHAERQPRFSWGSGDLVSTTAVRANYLAVLKAADRGEFAPLLAFVRR